MSWVLTATFLLAGLVLIVKGGDMFVDAASWMAEKTGIPKLIVGATVVSLATTLPEMLVSFIAAADGKVDMAIGNAVGSVTVNIGLIMGIALICIPAAIRRRDYLLRSVLMLAAAALLVLFGFGGSIGLLPGILLIGIFIVAMADNIHQARLAMAAQRTEVPQAPAGSRAGRDIASFTALPDGPAVFPGPDGAAAVPMRSAVRPRRETAVNIVKFVLGAACIILGSQLLVDNGSELAALLGVPERIIAISVVAIGTSLPELVTTVTAIVKKQHSLSVGNILGANIIDLTLILPVSALIAGKPLPVSSQFAMVDLPACLIIASLAMVPSLITQKFHRAQGVCMVVLYVGYLLFSTLVLR